jgi:Uma2 family endonuclease
LFKAEVGTPRCGVRSAQRADPPKTWFAPGGEFESGGRLPRSVFWGRMGAVQAVEHAASLSLEEYLAGELRSEIRHEYIGGLVYAMAGTSREHNIICQNLLIPLRAHLRGKPCQVFMENFKLRLRSADEDVFYYPDLIVTCDSRDTEKYFTRFPTVGIEVLSPDTERIDRREKFSSYTQIESLQEYILVAQDQAEATVFRRANQWRAEVTTQAHGQIRLESLDFSLGISAIYEGALP